MKNLNRVTMIGQLVADPEQKKSASGKSFSSFGLATNYSWKDAAGEWKSGVDFHRVISWGALAEKILQTCKKGQKVFLEGKLRTRSWETENGEKRYRTEIVATQVIPMKMEKQVAFQQAEDPVSA